MNGSMHVMEKMMNLFETKRAMNQSLTDKIDIRANSLQSSVEDHKRVITSIRQMNIRQMNKQMKAALKTK